MNSFCCKKLLSTLALAVSLPLFTTGALAGGSHSGGHGHDKKSEGHGHMKKKGHGHGASGGHGHGSDGHGHAKIDYSSVEEHVFGKAGDPAKAHKTVNIDMTDTLRFEPSEVRVKAGETVRFVVRNKGRLMHEMVLGTDESLHEHAEMMKKYPGMEHDEPHMAHVSPGKEHIMGWQFTKAGEYHFGCLVPGHFDGGMKGKVIVQ